jgi:hypothetical protein
MGENASGDSIIKKFSRPDVLAMLHSSCRSTSDRMPDTDPYEARVMMDVNDM